MSDTLAVGPIYQAISATAPLWDLIMLSQTTNSSLWSSMHWTSWFYCLNNTSVLPGVTSPLKVLIFWDAQVQTWCQGGDPHIWPGWSRAWHLQGWCRGNLSSSWLLWLCRWSGLPHWTPPFPWKGDLPVIILGVPTPQWVHPCIWRGTAGGCIYFTLCNVLC